MRVKIGVILLGILFLQTDGIGQSKGKFFYDTLTIMDYTTNMASERLSQLRKPIKRNFYLKSDVVSYSLFKGEVAQLSKDKINTILEDGLSLYIDKAEHQGHKNLIPSVLDILDADSEVVESLELSKMKAAALNRKLSQGAKVRFTGFIISVNEEKNGPLAMDVEVVE